MTTEKKEKNNNPELYIDYDNMTDFLNDYINCFKLDVYYRGALQSEEDLLPNAVKNRHQLKILKGCLDQVVSNQNSKFVNNVYSFLDLKSKVFVTLDLVPIAFKFLNLAKTEAIEEKKTLEVQLDVNEQIVIANTKVDSKQKEKEKVDLNIKTDNCIIYSESNENESYQKQNIKDNKEEEKLNKSEMYNNERQSTKQGSSNIALDDNVTDGIKLISPEENNSIKSEESSIERRILLKYLNSNISGYELKPSFLEKFLKSFKKFECIFSFSDYYSTSEEVKYEAGNTMERHKHEISKILISMQYVNNAEQNIKDAIRSIFLDQTTTTVSPNVFSGDIQKVQKVSSFAVSKTSDKSMSDDIFELDSKTENFNDEADELVKQLNKNIGFKIDTDGKKIFTFCGQHFNASESKQVIFNCKNEKVKISFIDSQISVSTENSEFHISFRKPKSVDIQDDCTQTETRQ